jgi:hypothetical protein
MMPRTLPALLPSLAARRPAATRLTRRRAARRAVVAGLAAVVALELGLGLASELYPRIRDPFYGDKLVKLQRKLADREPCVVWRGSSRTGFGFHGRRIEDRLPGVAAFNYGIPASGPVTHLVYVRRLLADGVKPDLLLLEVLPSMLADLPGGPLERHWVFGDRLTYRELDTVIRHGLPAGEVRRRWAEATFHPWYALRFQLLGRVVQSWIPWQLRFDWSRGADECGWGTPERDTITPDERQVAVARARLEYAPVLHDLTPGGHAADALRELLAVCRDHGVPVKLVLMPEGTEFRSWYPPAVRERLTAFLAGVCGEFGCECIDAREWVADDRFTDGHHLLRPGAEQFSDRLTDEVLRPWRK